jgi:hypothetical protein
MVVEIRKQTSSGNDARHALADSAFANAAHQSSTDF